jgi:hypothetical protein
MIDVIWPVALCGITDTGPIVLLSSNLIHGEPQWVKGGAYRLSKLGAGAEPIPSHV